MQIPTNRGDLVTTSYKDECYIYSVDYFCSKRKEGNFITLEECRAIENDDNFIEVVCVPHHFQGGRCIEEELNKCQLCKKIIYLDIDGTIMEHGMKRCNFGCAQVIKKLQDAGWKFIVNSFRADMNDDSIDGAIGYINDYIPRTVRPIGSFEFLEPITEYLKEKVSPDAWNLEEAIKRNVIYIDDMAYGIPLKPCCMTHGEMVDWDELEKQFIIHGVY